VSKGASQPFFYTPHKSFGDFWGTEHYNKVSQKQFYTTLQIFTQILVTGTFLNAPFDTLRCSGSGSLNNDLFTKNKKVNVQKSKSDRIPALPERSTEFTPKSADRLVEGSIPTHFYPHHKPFEDFRCTEHRN
jgi:hypothetical protein